MTHCAKIDCLDVQAMLEQVEGDAALLQDLIQVFLADGRKHVSEIEAAVLGADTDASRVAAHSLKGSVAVFGQTSFHRLAYEIESRSREGDLAAVRGLAKDLEPAFQDLSDSLSGVLQQLTAQGISLTGVPGRH